MYTVHDFHLIVLKLVVEYGVWSMSVFHFGGGMKGVEDVEGWHLGGGISCRVI